MTNSKVLVPSDGPDDWKRFLAQPDLHWATGYSARTLAYAWEAANGLPPEIAKLTVQAFGPSELILAIPEHKTVLPGGRRESQADVFILVRHPQGLATYTIEGKVDEPFGPTVGEWMIEASAGKSERLRYISELLGLSEIPPDIHYQLLHRTASALIEAERFDAKLAGMIVHSFSPTQRWRGAFERFAQLFGATAEGDAPMTLTVPSGRSLMLGWATGSQTFRSA